MDLVEVVNTTFFRSEIAAPKSVTSGRFPLRSNEALTMFNSSSKERDESIWCKTC
nr:MAG TPA: hypothetical protein [Caudoviricetes sp.]